MASQFPAALDQLASDKGNATVSADDHPTHHNQLADAVNAIQAALGAGLSNVAASTDPRLSNARAPTAHKASHATGGSDALTPGDIGAEPAGTAAAGIASHLAAADPHPQYATTAEAAAAAPVQSVAGRTGAVTIAAADISDSTAAGRAVLTAADAAAQRTALGLAIGTDVQGYDADLQAIGALAGTAGLLRKTAANTWGLDTASYLTGNQTVTVTGDASGSGATSIALTLANSGVAAGTYNDSATQVRPFTVDAKGRVTAVGAAVTITPAWASITGKPTTLSGYGITDAQPLDSDLTAIAALTHAADGFLVSDGTAWTRKTPADALVSLGLGTPTGTGNVVRATSPTLSSPTISGVLSLAAGTALLPSLAGPTDPDTGMWFPPGGNIVAWSTGGTERMRLTAAGDLGLGTTPGGGMKLDILGGNVNLTNGTYAAYQVVSGTVTGQLAANAGGTVDIRAVSNHALLLYTNNAERMRITSAGNVGIGTTNPTQLLHVNGNTKTTAGFFFGSDENYWYQAAANMAALRVGTGADTAYFTVLASAGLPLLNSSGTALLFGTVNAERMRIDVNGNVGIGTVSPGALLHLRKDTGAVDIRLQVGATLLGTAYASSSDFTLGSVSAIPLIFLANNGERMRITSAGFVGIGTNNPGTVLEVFGGNGQDQVRLSHGAGFAYRIGRDTGNGLLYFYGEQSGFNGYVFGGVNGERMRISSGGNVGIGTTDPLQPLHVIGSARFQGNIFNVNGFATVDLLESATGVGFRWALANNGTFRLQRSANGTYSDATTPILFDSSSRAIIGGTTAIGGTATVWGGLYLGANDSTAELQNYRASDNSGAAFSYLNKARGTIASPTVVQSGDGLGSMVWRGYDGATYAQAAIIRAEVDGTPGSGDMPGRLVFLTTLDGASTATERMRIKSAGQVRFVPLAADPAGAESGDVYYNSGTNKLRVYDGTAWVNLH